MKRFLFKNREIRLLFAIISVLLISSAINPVMISFDNLRSILINITLTSILASPFVLILTMREIDLSIAANFAFTQLIVAVFLKSFGLNVILSIFLTILIGIIIGAFNGFCISFLKINSFVTTLATMFMLYGLVSAITRGENIYPLPESFTIITSKNVIFGIPIMVFYAISWIIIFEILFRKNSYIRKSIFIGGNIYAAELVGINVKYFKLFGFIFAGIIGAIAGIFRASWYNAGGVYQDESLILIITTAVVLGGTSLYGGRGSVIGSFLGVVIITFIYNAINILGISSYWSKFVVGVFLIFAVILDTYTKRRGELRKS